MVGEEAKVAAAAAAALEVQAAAAAVQVETADVDGVVGMVREVARICQCGLTQGSFPSEPFRSCSRPGLVAGASASPVLEVQARKEAEVVGDLGAGAAGAEAGVVAAEP